MANIAISASVLYQNRNFVDILFDLTFKKSISQLLFFFSLRYKETSINELSKKDSTNSLRLAFDNALSY